jgi:integrase
MPRKIKGARLQLRAPRRDAGGHITHQATWRIRDGKNDVGTGCLEREIAAAERKLEEYISSKYQPVRKEQDIDAIDVADVLSIFVDDRPEAFSDTTDGRRLLKRIERLNAFFGPMRLSQVNGETCRGYQRHRGNTGGARRDLEDLRSAINHHAAEGLHRGIVRITLPKKGQPRDRWLTRGEAARLIRECWRAREVQHWSGQAVITDKRPLRHLARFILIGLYSGTRAGAIASASPLPAVGRSYVDLDRGIFYRLATGKAATNKRQPPVPIPARLLAHMRRWHDRRLIAAHFVEWNGAGVKSVTTAFRTAVRLAKLGPGVTPHTLRHTAATWLMQNGTDLWQAAGYLGMSVETLERTYGHHHPDHLQDAVTNITAKPRIAADRRVVPLRGK